MSERAEAFGVLFDLDGTLVDSLTTIGAAMSRTLEEFGHEFTAEAIIPLIGAPMQILAQQLTGVSESVAEEMYQRYLSVYYDEFIETTQPFDGANELLDRLHRGNSRLAVVTNKNEHGGKMMVEIQGWTGHFITVIGRDTTARPKPAPDGALHALAALEVAPANAAFVGDTEFDMEAATNAEIAVRIGLTGARSRDQLMASGATHVIDTLTEVDAILLEQRTMRSALSG